MIKSPLARLFAAGLLSLSLSLVPVPAGAQTTEVVMALPNTSLTFSLAYVAQDLGFWSKRGLAVKLPVITGPAAMNAVIAGSAEFSHSTALTYARAAAKGQKMLALANTMSRPLTEIVLRKEVAEAAHFDPSLPWPERAKVLKGKTIAVAGVTTPEHILLRIVALRAGFDPDNDIRMSIIPAGNVLAALASKVIDGFSMSIPWPLQAVQDGSSVVIESVPRGDLSEYMPMGYNLLVTRPEVCKQKPALCRAMVGGLADAAEVMKNHPEQALAVLQKRFEQLEPAVLKTAFDLMRSLTPLPPTVTAADFAKAEDYNIAAGLMKPEEKLASYDGLFTDEYFK